MNFRHSRREDPEINLIPMIDTILFLLLFFAVTTSFTRQSEISVNLPEASAAAEQTPEPPLEVVIDAQGRYYINNQQLVNQQIDTLKRALEKAMPGQKEVSSLLITADGQTPHQAVITAMDAARQIGIVHVSLATREPESH
jgi:biopolymer transport protein ExbD